MSAAGPLPLGPTMAVTMDEDEARKILGDAAPTVTVTPQGIVIAAGYSEALARLLRWVPKAIWRPDRRGWLVPLAGAEALRSVLPEIIRLAEAANEERRAETPASRPQPTELAQLEALTKSIKQGGEAIAAWMESAAAAGLDSRQKEKLVVALRGEAARLIGIAERLKARGTDAVRDKTSA